MIRNFSTHNIVGGYKHKDGTKKIVEKFYGEFSKTDMYAIYSLDTINGVQGYQMEGFILGKFLEDFLAAKPGDPLTYRSKRYEVMTQEEVNELVNQGIYIESLFS